MVLYKKPQTVRKKSILNVTRFNGIFQLEIMSRDNTSNKSKII